MKAKLFIIIKILFSLLLGLQVSLLFGGLSIFDFVQMNLRVYPLIIVFIIISSLLIYIARGKKLWGWYLLGGNILLFIINFKVSYPDRPIF